MDVMYCMMMAIYMMLAANSKNTSNSARKFLICLSAVMALMAVINMLK